MTAGRLLLSLLAVLGIVLAGCTGAGAASPSAPGASAGTATGIAGTATAGPACPVQKNPPDPSCADRPVAGAVVVVRAASGAEVARVTTDASGAFAATLPAGDYVIEPQPVTGLMGTPAAQPVTVLPGAIATVELVYDTGIRLPVSAS